MINRLEALEAWLDSREFYELCQQYRWARDAIALPGMLTAAEAFEELKRQIRNKIPPMEPTDAMLKAMADCYDATWGYPHDSGVELDWARKSYMAMLAAL